MIRLLVFLITGYWNVKWPWHRHVWEVKKETHTEVYSRDTDKEKLKNSLPVRTVHLYILTCKECGKMDEYRTTS